MTVIEDQPRLKLDALLSKVELTKSEVIWILEYIKSQIVMEDPKLLGLSQPRLLKNYLYFAKTSLLIIHQWDKNDQEMSSILHWLREAAYGLDSKTKRELETD